MRERLTWSDAPTGRNLYGTKVAGEYVVTPFAPAVSASFGNVLVGEFNTIAEAQQACEQHAHRIGYRQFDAPPNVEFVDDELPDLLR